MSKNFDEKFTKTTSLVLGGFDKTYFIMEEDDNNSFDDLLLKRHLWQKKPLIYERNSLTDNPLNPVNWAKILLHSSLTFFQNYIGIFRPRV